MESLSLDNIHFLIFIIPGFITVWSFRYFSKSDKKGDFEFLGLSFIWGMICLLFFEAISKQENIKKLLENPYSAAIILSIFGGIFGFFGAHISKSKSFKKIIKFISPK